ncbi:hypothetical protein JTE90_022632 [Oedothorax gibbosus]|uniref:Uncharacterized protein n=1 Tax=Oedothorax gibbosus TaxID=931172 RepID=A0AAV6TUP9_9ARAC|nr:hypothetical protein JTE90_022632 [Oedothorax gibbosus]
MERRGRKFTLSQIHTIQSRVEKWKDTDEMALLVWLILYTKLKMRDLLGWFNNDPVLRCKFLQTHEMDDLMEYANAPRLLPKTHQAYLYQWKRVCNQWFGIQGATFEMLRRKPDGEIKTATTIHTNN